MKQPTPEQIETDINSMESMIQAKEEMGLTDDHFLNQYHKPVAVMKRAVFALRFLQKAMGKPSERMFNLITTDDEYSRGVVTDIFTAMRDQMLREVENDG